MLPFLPPTFAVHISDGVLQPTWEWAGFAAAGLLALFGAWRIRDEEIPRVALLTAAFFVASQIHVQVPAGPSTHLLLNGLLGVVLGRRALLAVPVGLFLQVILFGHGGFYSLGVNSVVMGLPALLAALLFAGLRRLPWLRRPWFRAALVAGSVLAFGLSLVYAVTLLVTNDPRQLADADPSWADRVTFHPATLAAAALLAALAAWAERRLEHAPEFPLGLVVGESAVLATILLHTVVLIFGGRERWYSLALLTFIIHLPLAVLEGAILGFAVGFLARVKPEMLGWTAPERAECAAESLP
ncbi:MAG TPA: energy-coupling factor ABC transporter permease [Gemmataceae bacterium]|nr:energy-coupling factor ABC transporter permease [Gemmataceae bacterium]